ncbi:hypothetical protein CRUP_017515, partial [Coryphaenoides rupestris]
YSIDRHTDLERLFNIDSANGSITTLKALDREMSRWHNISVVATEIIDSDNQRRGHGRTSRRPQVCVQHHPANPNFTIVDREGCYTTAAQTTRANILTRRGGFRRREMSLYFLPVVISDNDYPIQSSTSTLIMRVCACDSRGNMQTCNP